MLTFPQDTNPLETGEPRPVPLKELSHSERLLQKEAEAIGNLIQYLMSGQGLVKLEDQDTALYFQKYRDAFPPDEQVSVLASMTSHDIQLPKSLDICAKKLRTLARKLLGKKK